MRYVVIIFIIIWCLPAPAQIIKGHITSGKNEPILAANIFLKGSYDGTISDTTGFYSFKTSLTGQQTLVVSFIGYKNFEIDLNIEKGKEYNINAVLAENSTQLGGVYITAGTFEAGDKKRGVQLKAIDILTTPNSNGDIYSALNTMPGAQMVGEEGVLFVRGGEKNESKTFVDGMLVANPYTSKLPDMPMRGRFSPSLFTGVQFSTGGYSAEYGQALSSALILQSIPFPTKTFTSITLMPFGAGINQTIKGDSISFFGTANYYNMKPYFNAVPQKTSWTKEPESIDMNTMFRKKFSNGGQIKSFGAFSRGKSGLILPSYLSVSGNKDLILSNTNFYLNTIYNGPAFNDWSLKTGLAISYDAENFDFEKMVVHSQNKFGEFRLSLQKNISGNLSLKTGCELSEQLYNQHIAITDSAFEGTAKFSSPLSAAFIEAEWKISERIFARIGGRFEYVSLPDEFSVSPRISVAYKTGEYSQISAAFGTFSQMPQNDYVKFAPDLKQEKAIHYILNYQYTRSNRLFRIEGYYKDYQQLVRYKALNDYNQLNYNNNGYGYARGVELFFRDQRTLRNGDYWISYSFLDTKKLYQDFSTIISPTLFSKHTATVVGKYYFSKIRSQIGITYQYASGRPYFLPGTNMEKQSFTGDFHDLSANISYLTSIFNWFTILHVSVSNVFGINHTYGYHFTKESSGTGYKSYAIKPQAKRFFVIALLITFDKNYIEY